MKKRTQLDLFGGAPPAPGGPPAGGGAPPGGAPPGGPPRGGPPAGGPPSGGPPSGAQPPGGPAAPRARPDPEPDRVLTVRALARLIRGSLEERFSRVLVRGEISNLRRPGSGHLYFSLKDDGACVRAVLFKAQAALLRFRPEDGQEILVRGRVTFYETGGDAQLSCDVLEPVGAGALALAFEQLKKKLSAEGLFDPARKRPLPFLPRRIGVVTSPTGAAVRDFLRVLHRRFPGIGVLIAPVRVQGDGAAAEIAAAIRRLGARKDLQVIVATRGGGSLEDLWAFNEEVVARAIAACPLPVVSAVGHEVDVTISDLVADVRAPTPTAAAELLAPVAAELLAGLHVARARLHRAARQGVLHHRSALRDRVGRLGDPRTRLGAERLRLDGGLRRGGAALRRAAKLRRDALRELARRLRGAHPAAQLRRRSRELEALRARLLAAGRIVFQGRRALLHEGQRRLAGQAPSSRIEQERRRLDSLAARLGAAGDRLHAGRRVAVVELRGRLLGLSPLAVLGRGYAIAFRDAGTVLTSASDVAPGERLHLELAQGALSVEVLGPAAARKEPGGG